MGMLRAYKFRLYPTKAQAAELNEMLGTFCWLYNRALEERRDGWKNYGWSFSYFQQSMGLKHWRRQDERLAKYSAAAELRVLRRLDIAFEGFFRRVRAGAKAGYPRFKPAARFDSADFVVGNGLVFRDERLRVVGINGTLRAKWHRSSAKPKIVTIKREGRKWFAICMCEVDAPPAQQLPFNPVGIDAGLTSLVTLSTGAAIGNPQWAAKSSKRIRRLSRALARAEKGSKRRKKAKERLAEAHRKAARQRRDFLHKLSREVVGGHSHIAIEDLGVAGMAKARPLARAIYNAAWTTLRNMIEYKAAEAGVQVVAVRPHGTSQTCSGCGVDVPKKLSVRIHDCPHCGLVIDRDWNAARNILARAEFRPGTGHQAQSGRVAA